MATCVPLSQVHCAKLAARVKAVHSTPDPRHRRRRHRLVRGLRAAGRGSAARSHGACTGPQQKPLLCLCPSGGPRPCAALADAPPPALRTQALEMTWGWEMASENVKSGYCEGLLRGYRGSLLTAADYTNLSQCENLDDVKLHLNTTDYGPYLANEPSPLHPATIVEKCTQKLVDEWNHLRCQARAAVLLLRSVWFEVLGERAASWQRRRRGVWTTGGRARLVRDRHAPGAPGDRPPRGWLVEQP